ncbi:hypothetical protein [Edaphobacter albus]|nr:hypothetical protein [Edaphobacter sp. 4G125]
MTSSPFLCITINQMSDGLSLVELLAMATDAERLNWRRADLTRFR